MSSDLSRVEKVRVSAEEMQESASISAESTEDGIREQAFRSPKITTKLHCLFCIGTCSQNYSTEDKIL